MTRLLASLLSACLLVACSSDDDAPSKPKSALSFSADAPGTVSLRAKAVTDQKLVLELVAQDVSSLYGLAYRLQYDPAVLRFAEQKRGAGFSTLITLEAAKAPRPGLLVGAITAKGDQTAIAAKGVVLAEVSFDVLKLGGTRVDFVVGRSGVFDSAGKSASATFTGGELRLR